MSGLYNTKTKLHYFINKLTTMNQSVALVLSSGGSRGLAQIGVISELENGFNITSISGQGRL